MEHLGRAGTCPNDHQRIVENVDVLVGNEEDLQLGLGIPGPEAGSRSKLDPSAFFGMIDQVVSKYPMIKVVATTLREVQSTNRHSWGAVAWIDGKSYISPTCELDMYDRVGGGDGFASGLFYGLLTGEPEQEAVNLGWAHGALLTTFPWRYHHGNSRTGDGLLPKAAQPASNDRPTREDLKRVFIGSIYFREFLCIQCTRVHGLNIILEGEQPWKK